MSRNIKQTIVDCYRGTVDLDQIELLKKLLDSFRVDPERSNFENDYLFNFGLIKFMHGLEPTGLTKRKQFLWRKKANQSIKLSESEQEIYFEMLKEWGRSKHNNFLDYLKSKLEGLEIKH